MHRNWLARATAATAFGVVASLGVATPGWANTNISINPGNVPTTAADFEQECSGNLGGGPFAGKDVWVFNLPGNHATTGDFVTVVAKFDTDGNGTADTNVTIEAGAADGDDIVTIGTSKAWVVTPAGWTLVDATATITGTAKQFVLTHTCAGSPEETPTPTPTPSESESPSETPSESESSSEGSSAVGGNTGGSGGGAGLPITGAPVGAMVLVGLGMVGAGAALLALRRRRDLVDLARS